MRISDWSSDVCSSDLSFSTRRTWRSPAKSVARKAVTHALAMSMPVSRAPIATTLASLCSRASFADSGSDTSAQRHAGLRLTEIEMPIPDPRSEEQQAELPSLMRISDAVFCLNNKNTQYTQQQH